MQCPKCGYPGAAINGDCPRCNQNEAPRAPLTAPPVEAPSEMPAPKASRAGLWQGLAIAAALVAVIAVAVLTQPKRPVVSTPPPAAVEPTTPAPVDPATTPGTPTPATPTAPAGQPLTTTKVVAKAEVKATPPVAPKDAVVGKLPSQDPKMGGLFKAINDGRTDLVADILKKNKADAKITDKDGKTPLHWVAEATATPVSPQVRRELAALLLNAGADPNARSKDLGETPLISAAWTGNDAALMADALLTAGADVNAKAKYPIEEGSTTFEEKSAYKIASDIYQDEFTAVLAKFKAVKE
jgi:hypothetical protein